MTELRDISDVVTEFLAISDVILAISDVIDRGYTAFSPESRRSVLEYSVFSGRDAVRTVRSGAAGVAWFGEGCEAVVWSGRWIP